jgi:hypothetical protein
MKVLVYLAHVNLAKVGTDQPRLKSLFKQKYSAERIMSSWKK